MKSNWRFVCRIQTFSTSLLHIKMKNRVFTEVVCYDVSVCYNLVQLTGIYADETNRFKILHQETASKGMIFSVVCNMGKVPLELTSISETEKHGHKILEI